MQRPTRELPNARRTTVGRAFSLIELVAVLTIVSLLSGMAYLRFGESAVNSTAAEGFVRTLMLDLRQARARTISSGDNHYVLLNRQNGNVASYTLHRQTPGGAVVVDRTVQVPAGAIVTTATDQWEFDFDGSLSGGSGVGSILVAGDHFQWTITIYRATGVIKSTKVAL